jgi:hypothetical protein
MLGVLIHSAYLPSAAPHLAQISPEGQVGEQFILHRCRQRFIFGVKIPEKDYFP